jgi:hypothetical protein
MNQTQIDILSDIVKVLESVKEGLNNQTQDCHECQSKRFVDWDDHRVYELLTTAILKIEAAGTVINK